MRTHGLLGHIRRRNNELKNTETLNTHTHTPGNRGDRERDSWGGRGTGEQNYTNETKGRKAGHKMGKKRQEERTKQTREHRDTAKTRTKGNQNEIQ